MHIPFLSLTATFPREADIRSENRALISNNLLVNLHFLPPFQKNRDYSEAIDEFLALFCIIAHFNAINEVNNTSE